VGYLCESFHDGSSYAIDIHIAMFGESKAKSGHKYGRKHHSALEHQFGGTEK